MDKELERLVPDLYGTLADIDSLKDRLIYLHAHIADEDSAAITDLIRLVDTKFRELILKLDY